MHTKSIITWLGGAVLATCVVPLGAQEPASKEPAPIRVLVAEMEKNTSKIAERLRGMKVHVVALPWNEVDPNQTKDIDVLLLPTHWAGEAKSFEFFEGMKDRFHKFVERGGGLLVCQPNPVYSRTCKPALLPYAITFACHYNEKDATRKNLAQDHFITEDLPDKDMPFPYDPMRDVDPRYRILAKQASTGAPSLAVCTFGKGRVVVQTANENYGATIPISDEILRRMLAWAARREK